MLGCSRDVALSQPKNCLQHVRARTPLTFPLCKLSAVLLGRVSPPLPARWPGEEAGTVPATASGQAAGPGGSAGPMVASAPLFSPLCVTIQVVAGTHVSVTTSIVVFEKATFLYLLLHFIPFFCFLLSPWTPPRQLTPQLFFHYYPSSATSGPKFCTSGAKLAQSTATAGLSQ